jgi:hypothetical protein
MDIEHNNAVKLLNDEQLQFAHGYGLGYDGVIGRRVPTSRGRSWVPASSWQAGWNKGVSDALRDHDCEAKILLRDARKRAVVDPAYNPERETKPRIILVDADATT